MDLEGPYIVTVSVGWRQLGLILCSYPLWVEHQDGRTLFPNNDTNLMHLI